MAEIAPSALIQRLQAANPHNHNQMWELGIDLSRHFGLAPFHTTGAANPATSIDAVTDLMKLVLGKSHPHLFMAINGLMNPPCAIWRAEIGWPDHNFRGRGKSPALALCIALLRAHDGHATNCDTETPLWLQAEVLQGETRPG